MYAIDFYVKFKHLMLELFTNTIKINQHYPCIVCTVIFNVSKVMLITGDLLTNDHKKVIIKLWVSKAPRHAPN